MRGSPDYQSALGVLRQKLVAVADQDEYREVVARREEVFARYRPLFSPEGVDELTAEEFKSFLYYENNHHWLGLNRLGWKACEDMPALRASLRSLFDESRPIEQRFDEAITAVPGMGKALTTAILVVAFPEKYGVWNNTSEASLREIGIWPEFPRGTSAGQRYVRVNSILNELAEDLGVDLWALDALHPAALEPPDPAPDGDEQAFYLEKYLQEFLFTNWEKIELGREWTIYSRDGDKEAGFEFPTDIGRIDLLAKHVNEPRWLVIELKRNQTTDDTVGQVLRYMGWVQHKLASPDERVEGLIIARRPDLKLHYALSRVTNVSVRTYRVAFSLHEPAMPDADVGGW